MVGNLPVLFSSPQIYFLNQDSQSKFFIGGYDQLSSMLQQASNAQQNYSKSRSKTVPLLHIIKILCKMKMKNNTIKTTKIIHNANRSKRT